MSRRHKGEAGSGSHHRGRQAADETVAIAPEELQGIISVPGWLRDLGTMSWLLVGIALAATSLIALLGLTQVIVAPVIVAAIIAAVGSPLVSAMARHRIPRGLGAALILLAVVVVIGGVVVVIIAGVASEASSISGHLGKAQNTIAGWLNDIGVDPSKSEAAKQGAGSGLSSSFDALLGGLLVGIRELSSLAFFLALTVLSTLFLLKDGPSIRAWGEGHLGLPRPVARTISMRVVSSLRGYFLGVTIIAVFNVVVVTIGALLLGVPLVGTIAIVTFVGGFIPYLGAWGAAGFSVLLALGGAGPEAAGGMVIVQLLANGLLQQMVQPFAMGAALGIHPLAVLIVTIAGGALFGMVGLVLAAPLTSAVTRISADLARARAGQAAASGDPPGPGPRPGPAPATPG